MASIKWGGHLLPKAYVVAESPREERVMERLQSGKVRLMEVQGSKCLAIPATQPMDCIICLKKQLYGFRPRCKKCILK